MFCSQDYQEYISSWERFGLIFALLGIVGFSGRDGWKEPFIGFWFWLDYLEEDLRKQGLTQDCMLKGSRGTFVIVYLSKLSWQGGETRMKIKLQLIRM